MGKDDVTSIFISTDSPIYKGQQPLCENVFLRDDSNLFWKEEGKAARALRGTQTKFEFHFVEEKSAIWGLTKFLPAQDCMDQSSLNTAPRMCVVLMVAEKFPASWMRRAGLKEKKN